MARESAVQHVYRSLKALRKLMTYPTDKYVEFKPREGVPICIPAKVFEQQSSTLHPHFIRRVLQAKRSEPLPATDTEVSLRLLRGRTGKKEAVVTFMPRVNEFLQASPTRKTAQGAQLDRIVGALRFQPSTSSRPAGYCQEAPTSSETIWSLDPGVRTAQFGLCLDTMAAYASNGPAAKKYLEDSLKFEDFLTAANKGSLPAGVCLILPRACRYRLYADGWV
jgi:hypothetical protein